MADQRSIRLGLLGGTFDPVHVGHLIIAVEAAYQLNLDRVWLVVAHDPWQKSATTAVTPSRVRLAMVEAAVAGCDGLEASSIEIDRGGPSYTIDTVLAVAADHDPVLVVGADTAARIDTWHRAGELARMVSVAVATRPGHRLPVLGQRWRTERFEPPAVEISSSDIRRRCAGGEPIDFQVPAAVRSIIAAEGLYGFG